MRLTFLAVAALALAACEPAPTASDGLDGRWDVQEIAGASLGEGVDVWLELDTTQGVISGFSGCNIFSAPLSTFSNSLSIGAISEQQAECPSAEAATDEARLLAVLPHVQRHIRRGASLELLPAPQGSEALLKLRVAEPAAD